VKLGALVSKETLWQVQFEIQESIAKMEWGGTTKLNYILDGGEIVYILKGMKKEYFMENDVFDREGMKTYLMTMWYSEKDVLSMMQNIA
jgi:hypothetical protein